MSDDYVRDGGQWYRKEDYPCQRCLGDGCWTCKGTGWVLRPAEEIHTIMGPEYDAEYMCDYCSRKVMEMDMEIIEDEDGREWVACPDCYNAGFDL